MMRLWQTLLGTLMISSLACGGGSGSGTGHDGGLDGGETLLDGATGSPDLASFPSDQAASSIDQASAANDLAYSVDHSTPNFDLVVLMDVGTFDTPATPDVPVQLDLASPGDVTLGPDLFVTPDLASSPDMRSPSDVPSTQDLHPPADLPPALDVPEQTDTLPALDLSTAIDTNGAVDTGGDTTPQILWPDKLTYGLGEQLTAHFTNGSTDTAAWIGIFPVGAADTAYRDWQYTDGATEGTMVLHVPGTAGTYELRMFKDVGYTRIATSVPFVVQ